MRFTILYETNTTAGKFLIGRCESGRYHPIYNGESLGFYHRADQAAEDLAGGHTSSIPGISDTSLLGIPTELGEWTPVGRAGGAGA